MRGSFPRLHCFDKDGIAVTLTEYHDVLIALVQFLGELARLICPNLLSGGIFDIQNMVVNCFLFVGRAWRWRGV